MISPSKRHILNSFKGKEEGGAGKKVGRGRK